MMEELVCKLDAKYQTYTWEKEKEMDESYLPFLITLLSIFDYVHMKF